MGASVVAGVSLLSLPALANSLTGVSVTGENRVFMDDGDTTLELISNPSNNQLVDALLSRGNVELDDNIDGGFVNETESILTADFDGGYSIMLGSVGADYWTNANKLTWWNTVYGDAGNKAVIDGLFANPLSSGALAQQGINGVNDIFGALNAIDIFAKMSDPNIQSVTSNNGEFTFELAGHDSMATKLAGKSLDSFNLANPNDAFAALFQNIVLSEAVKYSLDGGETWDYTYAVNGSNSYASGVVDGDDNYSHARNFKFTVGEAAKVPEPSTLLGLAAIGGLVVASKRRKNA
ncbi:NF038130 family PEP-CTERM protein [Roseofilum sp. BLCC_M143]|uniref:NF038130 family PEP-CTERM protein n=2 Tax=Roseofilum TaxID=1233426 RepID=A0ABT7BWT0_9CYAN|nr:NF038130 family PEP-CTERM protein [Roseofilum casamattae BLCC-M143]